MVVELLLKPKVKNWSFLRTFLAGVLYSFIGAGLALWLFPSQASMIMVFLTMLCAAPFMYNLLKYEEKHELDINERTFLAEYRDITLMLLTLFVGITIGFFLLFSLVSLPSNNAPIHTVSIYDLSPLGVGDINSQSILENQAQQQILNEILATQLDSPLRVLQYDFSRIKSGEKEYRIQHISTLRQKSGYWFVDDSNLFIILINANAQNADTQLLLDQYLRTHQVRSNPQGTILQLMESQPAKFEGEFGEILFNTHTYSKRNPLLDTQLQSVPFVLDAQASQNHFVSILANNSRVLVICLIFSFLFGFGALFILVWNASVISAALTRFVVELYTSAPVLGSIIGLLRFFTHGLFEIAAFFIAGLAGGILSFGILNHELGTNAFRTTFFDFLQLLVFALILLVFAAAVEVWITPLLF